MKKVLLAAIILAIPLIVSPLFGENNIVFAQAPLKTEKSKVPDFYLRFPIGNISKISSDDFKQGKALPNYITGIYKWMVGMVAILAVVALMVGGVTWMLAGGSKGRVDTAKKTITNALVGLLLALGSYLFLWTISPNLVQFQPLRITEVGEIKLFINKSCDSICRTEASKRATNLVGSGEDAKCTPGSETQKTPKFKQVCVKDGNQTCLCDFITREKGDKNCLTPGLECPKNLYCDTLKNECVDKTAADGKCVKDIECQDGYSCLPDPSDPTNKDKFKCKQDAKTTLNGMCCYVGFEKDPKDPSKYSETPKAIQEPQDYRTCQNRETREVRGGFKNTDQWVWCESDTAICSKEIPVLQGGTQWSFDYNAMKSAGKNCYLFRRSSAPYKFSP